MDLALVIGCQRYEDEQVSALKYAEGDARRFAEAIAMVCDLELRGTQMLSTDPEREREVRLPTRNAILRALTPPPGLTQPDKLFFYFSGHGVQSILTNEPYLLPSDTVLLDIENSAVSVSVVMEKLKSWQAKTTIVFLDVCRAAFGRDKAGLSYRVFEKETMEHAGLPGSAVFFSCSPGQSSFECEHPDVMGGVFTHVLCEALASSTCRTIRELQTFLVLRAASVCDTYQSPYQHQRPYLVVEPVEVQDRYLVSIRKLRERDTPLSMVTFVPAGIAQSHPDKNGADFLPLICGFDFGTSHCVCSVSDSSGKVALVPMQGARALLPSTLRFTDDLRYQVGATGPDGDVLGEYRHFVPNIKRIIGHKNSIAVAGVSFRPEELASLIIRAMREATETYFGRPIEYALVSAPTRFTVRQCESLLEAFQLAGVRVGRLIAEPASASLMVDPGSPNTVNSSTALVLDLGGGTLDVAVLEYGEGVCEILASSGDRVLGGVDYDSALSGYLMQQCEIKGQGRNVQIVNMREDAVAFEAERIKKLLGLREEASALIDIETGQGLEVIEIPVTRAIFRAVVKDLDVRVRACIEAALRQARLAPRQINSIVLAGLGAKVFTVRDLISEIFPSTPIEDRFQETAVATGLGLYTGVLKGTNKEVLLLDALPTQIAIRCVRYDDLFTYVHSSREANVRTDVLLARDTTIPTKRRMVIELLGPDPSTGIFIDIVEEGGHVTPDEAGLGSIPASIAQSGDRVEIFADVDANRTIKLVAVRLRKIAIVPFEAQAALIARHTGELELGVRLPNSPPLTTFEFGHGNRASIIGSQLELHITETPLLASIEVEIYERLAQRPSICTVSIDLKGAFEVALSVERVTMTDKVVSGVVNVFRRDHMADAQLNNTFLAKMW